MISSFGKSSEWTLCSRNSIKSSQACDPDGYRLSENPFFLKFCPRVVFNPDDKGLFKGIYLPLDLWKRSNAAGRLKRLEEVAVC